MPGRGWQSEKDELGQVHKPGLVAQGHLPSPHPHPLSCDLQQLGARATGLCVEKALTYFETLIM